jgi:outer membrane receptor protein involved in Fe transport
MFRQTLSKLFFVGIFLCIGMVSFAQEMVTGKVSNEENPNGLEGVTVSEKGTTNSVATDKNGQYTIKVKNTNAVLVFKYVGMLPAEVALAGKNTADAMLKQDLSQMSDVIVTSSRVPVRKLEATTANNIISSKQLALARPEGISEAVMNTPGIYSSFSQGRFRGAIFTRGFPDGSGNGLVYTGILMDGLPTLATTARPPDFAIGMDPNFERVEVVRGSTATLFGYSAAAGVVNMINRTGGEKMSGVFRATYYNENVSRYSSTDYRIEGNINGAFNKAGKNGHNWRYNLGGYYINDRGFRDMGYKDIGGQIRANIDWVDPKRKHSFRAFFAYMDVTIQNMIDIPFKYKDQLPKDGWNIRQSYYTPYLDTINYTIRRSAPGSPLETRSIKKMNEEGNYAKGGYGGFMFSYKLDATTEISNKFRIQSYDHGTKFNLGVSTAYSDAAASNVRVLVDGDGNDRDVMEEFRITKTVNGKNIRHRVSIGTYLSWGRYTVDTWSLTGWSFADRTKIGLNSFFPTNIAPKTGTASRNDKYAVNTQSFFLGDEMKIGDKLSLVVGLRYDEIAMELKGIEFDTTRNETHADWTASIGFNYLLSNRSAMYGNITRAFRMPDYSAYTPIVRNAGVNKPRIATNEIATNFELGYRGSSESGELGFDIAGFYTYIDNRLATIYDGAFATLKPFGSNSIYGAELSMNYTPAEVRGLTFSTSFTLQKATFDKFKIVANTVSTSATSVNVNGPTYGNKLVIDGVSPIDGKVLYSWDLKGNQLPRVPSMIWNTSLSYDHKYFGVNGTLNYNIGRYADGTNVVRLPDIAMLNLGAYVQYQMQNKQSFRLSLQVKNAIGADRAERLLYVEDNDAMIGLQQRFDAGTLNPENTYFTGIPLIPQRILFTLEYKF